MKSKSFVGTKEFLLVNKYKAWELSSQLNWIFPHQYRYRLLRFIGSLVVVAIFLTSCALPQVSAEERMFLDFSVDFLGEYQLSKQTLGNLSAITYQLPGYGQSSDGIHFYALSDDATENSLARLYTLKWDLMATENQITLEKETVLQDKSGQPLSQNTIDPESLVFSPRKSVFVATEMQDNSEPSPFVAEFDLETGQLRNTVPIPPSYLRQTQEEELPKGIQKNLGFQSITIAPDGFSPGGSDPFRLFTATAAPLIQDLDAEATKIRVLHYVIADRASFLVSEMLYPLEFDPTAPHQLADLVALNQGGYFLSLERSPNSAQIYQVFTADATDTSRIASLRGELSKVQPLRKQLLFNLDQLGLSLQNLTAMTLGPRLPDGTQSLILVNDDPQTDTTQFLLLSLKLS